MMRNTRLALENAEGGAAVRNIDDADEAEDGLFGPLLVEREVIADDALGDLVDDDDDGGDTEEDDVVSPAVTGASGRGRFRGRRGDLGVVHRGQDNTHGRTDRRRGLATMSHMPAQYTNLHIATIRRGIALAAVPCGTAALLAGCIFSSVAAPQGTAPLRYRDPVFQSVDVAKDLQYGSGPALDGGGTVALKLDLYTPAGDTVAKRPAIVWVHGGGYVGGDKATGVAAVISDDFAKQGYAVAVDQLPADQDAL